ncbi:MAG TPA: cytochrome P450 [Myxococcaceae bacterium]|nr:cytochrome P450 [Myxococcaceae bacterium]
MSSTPQNPHLNPVSPENLLNPFLLYKTLRDCNPVHWSSELQAWLITRHEDVAACFRDPRLSADRTKLFEYQVPGMDPAVVKDFVRYARLQMAMKDGAEHLRLRRQANPGFAPQVLDTWRPAIRHLMEELVERVQARGRMELVKEISYQLPPLVIAAFFGIPAEDRERFQAWSTPLAEYASPPVGADMLELARRANTAMVEFGDYLARLVEERRRAPGEDMLSQMIRVQEAGGMSNEELVANALLMVFGGHITTTDQLTNTVHDLLTHPEQLQKLREDPGLAKSAAEESLRFSPAMPFHFRIAVEPIPLHGQTIPPGSIVFLGMASANRDPAVFPEPERYDITRDLGGQKLMSFAFGPHQCVGAGLARRELEIALQVLLERLPGLRLDEEQPPQPKCNSLLFRSFTSLPVRW